MEWKQTGDVGNSHEDIGRFPSGRYWNYRQWTIVTFEFCFGLIHSSRYQNLKKKIESNLVIKHIVRLSKSGGVNWIDWILFDFKVSIRSFLVQLRIARGYEIKESEYRVIVPTLIWMIVGILLWNIQSILSSFHSIETLRFCNVISFLVVI